MKRALIFWATVSSLLIGSTQASWAANPPVPTQVAQDGWTWLAHSLPQHEILEGSYEGYGQATRTRYKMHLIQYFEQPGTFMAVMENEQANLASLGFIKQESEGVYYWYEMRVEPKLKALDVSMTAPPLMRLQITLDEHGRSDRIGAVSTYPSAGLEAIEFSKARAPLLQNQIAPGRYQDRKSSLNIIGRSDQQLSLQMVSVDDRTGATSSINCIAQKERPGMYSARVSQLQDYQEQVSEDVAFVVVSVKEEPLFIWGGKYQLFEFTVNAEGTLSSDLHVFKRER